MKNLTYNQIINNNSLRSLLYIDPIKNTPVVSPLDKNLIFSLNVNSKFTSNFNLKEDFSVVLLFSVNYKSLAIEHMFINFSSNDLGDQIRNLLPSNFSIENDSSDIISDLTNGSKKSIGAASGLNKTMFNVFLTYFLIKEYRKYLNSSNAPLIDLSAIFNNNYMRIFQLLTVLQSLGLLVDMNFVHTPHLKSMDYNYEDVITLKPDTDESLKFNLLLPSQELSILNKGFINSIDYTYSFLEQSSIPTAYTNNIQSSIMLALKGSYNMESQAFDYLEFANGMYNALKIFNHLIQSKLDEI